MMNSKLFVVFLGLILAVSSAPSEETEKRLIQTSETEAKWLTQDEIFNLIDNGVTFMDVTGRDYSKIKPFSPTRAIPVALRYQSVVREDMSKVSASRIESFMVSMTEFHNRYYTSQWGVESANWILEQARELIQSTGYGGRATANAFTHEFAQPSIVVTIYGTDPSLITEYVILGAHQDSVVSGGNASQNRAPGGDDNASGSAALFEALRALLESGFVPKRTLEFHWYAAEEVGLRGSQAIAEAYSDLDLNVISMMNFDVVGYNVARNDIRIVTDYTDGFLNQLLRLAIVEYLNTTWENRACNYGCSDHASWNRVGVPSASPMEPVGSPYMHSTRDTLDTVSFTKVAQFAQLAVAYSVELSEPN